MYSTKYLRIPISKKCCKSPPPTVYDPSRAHLERYWSFKTNLLPKPSSLELQDVQMFKSMMLLLSYFFRFNDDTSKINYFQFACKKFYDVAHISALLWFNNHLGFSLTLNLVEQPSL